MFLAERAEGSPDANVHGSSGPSSSGSQIRTTVVADREFCFPALARWLTGRHLDICLRVKKHDRETLNRDLKSSGDDREPGKMTKPKRLENLLIPIAFAHILAVMQGHIEELMRPYRL